MQGGICGFTEGEDLLHIIRGHRRHVVEPRCLIGVILRFQGFRGIQSVVRRKHAGVGLIAAVEEVGHHRAVDLVMLAGQCDGLFHRRVRGRGVRVDRQSDDHCGNDDDGYDDEDRVPPGLFRIGGGLYIFVHEKSVAPFDGSSP